MDDPLDPKHVINTQIEAFALGRQKNRNLVEVYLALKVLVSTTLFSEEERKEMLSAVVENLEVDVNDLSRLAVEIRSVIGPAVGFHKN